MPLIFLLLFFCSTLFAETFQEGNFLNPISKLSLKDIEISSYASETKKLYGIGGDVFYEIDFSNPKNPKLLQEIKQSSFISSISIHKKYLALAFPGNIHEGYLKIYSIQDSVKLLREFKTCSGLDMITFSPDGNFLLGACEGVPSDDFSLDPEGGVLFLSMKSEDASINILKFNHLDSLELLKKGVRKSGPSSFFQSLEPEYITISDDSKIAWISLQENNAIAKLNIDSMKIVDVFPLGTLSHKETPVVVRPGNEIKWESLPIFGLRQSDGIASFAQNGKNYVLTANEGADMDYSAWKDALKWKKCVKDEKLDPKIFDSETKEALSKIKLAKDSCKKNELGECVAFYTFGTRSISLFDGDSGNLLWDSGNLIEKKMEKLAPNYFNWNSKKGKLKVNARSSSKGSEPENVTVGSINSKKYGFLGLERMSAIVVFDVSFAKNPQYKAFYMNSQDRGPEGILFISKEKSPTNTPLLIVCYEYSGTMTVFEVIEK